MEIIAGNIYFVRDSFFQKVADPYLKINYDTTKRPHYFAFQDTETSLYWLVPCSSKIEKFERILEQKRNGTSRPIPSKLLAFRIEKPSCCFRICSLSSPVT